MTRQIVWLEAAILVLLLALAWAGRPQPPALPPPGLYVWDGASLTLTVTSRDVAVCLPRLHRAPDCRDVVGWTGDR